MSANKYLNILLQKCDADMEWGFDIVGGRDRRSPLIISQIKNGAICSQYLSEGDIILQMDGIDANTLLYSEALSIVKRPSKSLDLLCLKSVPKAEKYATAGNRSGGKGQNSSRTDSWSSGHSASAEPIERAMNDDRRPRTELYSSLSEENGIYCSMGERRMSCSKTGSGYYYSSEDEYAAAAKSPEEAERDCKLLEEYDPSVKNRCKESMNFWKELEAGKATSKGRNMSTGSDAKAHTYEQFSSSDYLSVDKVEICEKVQNTECEFYSVKEESEIEISGTTFVKDDFKHSKISMAPCSLIHLPKSYKEFQNRINCFQTLRDEDNYSSLNSVETSSSSCSNENSLSSCSELSISSGYISEEARKQQSVTSDNSFIADANDGTPYQQYSNDNSSSANSPPPPINPQTAPPPPPPPPPPGMTAGNIPSMRLKSEIADRTELPAAIQNAMITKDKKPFTYTPGGLDLSQIRSPIMQTRIIRNAQASPDTVLPTPANSAGNAATSLPASAAAAMTPQLAIPVLPQNPTKNLNHVVLPSTSEAKSPNSTTFSPQLNRTPAPAWLQKPAVQPQDISPPWLNKVPNNSSNNNNAGNNNNSAKPSFTTPQRSSQAVHSVPIKIEQNFNSGQFQDGGSHVIPIQVEGTEQQTSSNIYDKKKTNRWSNPNENQATLQSLPNNARTRNGNDGYNGEQENPIQSKSFKVIQKITGSDGENSGSYNISPSVYNSEGVPLSQLRKLQLSNDDRNFMNRVKEQVDDDNYLHMETDPRYRGSAIPSRAFRILQNMTETGQVTRNAEKIIPVTRDAENDCRLNERTVFDRDTQYSQQQNVYIPPSERQVDEDIRKYTGSSIPSRSFRILQAMTATEPTVTEKTPESIVAANEDLTPRCSTPFPIHNPSSSLVIPTDVWPCPPQSADETFLLWQHYKYLHSLLVDNYRPVLKFCAYSNSDDATQPRSVGDCGDNSYRSTAFINLKIPSKQQQSPVMMDDNDFKVEKATKSPVEEEEEEEEEKDAKIERTVAVPIVSQSISNDNDLVRYDFAEQGAIMTTENYDNSSNEATAAGHGSTVGNVTTKESTPLLDDAEPIVSENDSFRCSENETDAEENASVSVTISLPLKKPSNEDERPDDDISENEDNTSPIDFWSELNKDQDDIYYKPIIRQQWTSGEGDDDRVESSNVVGDDERATSTTSEEDRSGRESEDDPGSSSSSDDVSEDELQSTTRSCTSSGLSSDGSTINISFGNNHLSTERNRHKCDSFDERERESIGESSDESDDSKGADKSNEQFDSSLSESEENDFDGSCVKNEANCSADCDSRTTGRDRIRLSDWNDDYRRSNIVIDDSGSVFNDDNENEPLSLNSPVRQENHNNNGTANKGSDSGTKSGDESETDSGGSVAANCAIVGESKIESVESGGDNRPTDKSDTGMRQIMSYERAATHSRLFKLLQESERSTVDGQVKLRRNRLTCASLEKRKKVVSLPSHSSGATVDFSSCSSSTSGIDCTSASVRTRDDEQLASELADDLLSLDEYDLSAYSKESVKEAAVRLLRASSPALKDRLFQRNRSNGRPQRHRHSADLDHLWPDAGFFDETFQRSSGRSSSVASKYFSDYSSSGMDFKRLPWPKCPRIFESRGKSFSRYFD